jgi:hypothetical protein
VSGLILHLSISQSHVFLLNSRLGLFTAASPSLEEAPLLPKLQGHFAEFLGRDSLEHLRILSLTTCVGLRYGSCNCKRLAGFLGSLIRVTISLPEGLEYYRVSARKADLPTSPLPTHFNVLFRQNADLSLLRHHITQLHEYWNINQLSIDYAFRLRLRSRLTLIRLALIRKP